MIELNEVATDHAQVLELSVVIPCLDEARTVANCVRRALEALARLGVRGEVIVADNGSKDGSRELARENGARVVDVAGRGYGRALAAGIAAARGRYVVMGDADDSYDFGEIERFLPPLREGHELVMGCRMPSGGGRVLPRAMPWSHRWIGNPMFSTLARWWFAAPTHDVYCGLRAFERTLPDRLRLKSQGMEYATEMVLKAAASGARISEVPVTLRPQGDAARMPHLRTFRDGWRTLRLFMLHSPRWIFLHPGLLFLSLGVAGFCVAMPGKRIGHVHFALNTLVVSGLLVLTGFQSILFGIGTRLVATREGLLPESSAVRGFRRWFTVERGLISGGIALLGGVLLIADVVRVWGASGFGDLDYEVTLRRVISGATLTALGVQVVLASFFIGMFDLATPTAADADPEEARERGDPAPPRP